MRILTNHSADRAIDVLASMLSVDGRLDGASPSLSLFALQALRDNLDVTLDVCVVKDNSGFAFDLPLLALDDGRLNVELNQAVTIPLGLMAADGADVHANLSHTVMFSFYDYLPDAAEA